YALGARRGSPICAARPRCTRARAAPARAAHRHARPLAPAARGPPGVAPREIRRERRYAEREVLALLVERIAVADALIGLGPEGLAGGEVDRLARDLDPHAAADHQGQLAERGRLRRLAPPRRRHHVRQAEAVR